MVKVDVLFTPAQLLIRVDFIHVFLLRRDGLLVVLGDDISRRLLRILAGR